MVVALLAAVLCVASLTSLTAPSATASSTQLLRNGGFGAGLAPWQVYQNVGPTTATVAASTGAPFGNGSRGVKVTDKHLNSSRNVTGIRQAAVARTVAGHRYVASVWVRRPASSRKCRISSMRLPP